MLGIFVGLAVRIAFVASHFKGSAGDGHHIDGHVGGGYGFGKVLEFLNHGCAVISYARCVNGGSSHLFVLVVGVIVTGIQVAVDTLKVELFLVLIIVKVSGNAIICQSLGENVVVTLFARLVIDNVFGIFHVALALEIQFGRIFRQIRPEILETCCGFCIEIFPCTLGR